MKVFKKLKIVEQLAQWWIAEEMRREKLRFHRQDRKERNRRLELIEELAVRLRAAKEKSGFATAYPQDAMAAIFNGDWKEVDALRRMVDPDDPGARSHFAPGSLEHMRDVVDLLKAVTAEAKA